MVYDPVKRKLNNDTYTQRHPVTLFKDYPVCFGCGCKCANEISLKDHQFFCEKYKATRLTTHMVKLNVKSQNAVNKDATVKLTQGIYTSPYLPRVCDHANV